jgi:hypothetical protein
MLLSGWGATSPFPRPVTAPHLHSRLVHASVAEIEMQTLKAYGVVAARRIILPT